MHHFWRIIQQRLGEVKCQNRKDVNVLCDWVITLPKDFPEGQREAFFRLAYDFCKLTYGKENVISAYVHMDETSPHMHFAFMPVVHDTKKDIYKVSAKEAITRRDLQRFHGDLERYMEGFFGRKVGILNDATREGNKSIAELKRQSATERLQEATAEASRIVFKAKKEAKGINDRLESKKVDFERKKGEAVELINAKARKVNKALKDVQDTRQSLEVERADLERQRDDAVRDKTASEKKLQEATEKASKIVSEAQEEAQRIKDSLLAVRAEYDAKKAYVRHMDKVSYVSMMYPPEAKYTEKGLVTKQRFITVPIEMWEAKHVAADEKEYLQHATDAFEKRLQEFS